MIILGIDSTSRLNFVRQYPVTTTFLDYNLHILQFVGFHKIGADTYSNLLPLLTGKFKSQLDNECLRNGSVFDDCQFIWNFFQRDKYSTAFGEDVALNGIFNAFSGFKKQPTTHYWNNFNMKAAKEIGNQKYINTPLCFGLRPAYTYLLDYIEKFTTSYHSLSSKFFGFFWSYGLTFDFLNYGSLGDFDFTNLLQNLHRRQVFNNTFMIIMSDHGTESGGILNTEQGRKEESLPLLWVVVPFWFRERHGEASRNMFINSRRLVTVFDVYETLKSISWNRFDTTASASKYRSSLFRPISSFRSCDSLGIKDEWCACN